VKKTWILSWNKVLNSVCTYNHQLKLPPPEEKRERANHLTVEFTLPFTREVVRPIDQLA
jgi:hypothetical protein